MKKSLAGFSMLELMVVIAIIAILALLALPNFSDKIVREQIAEALPLADIIKPPIAAEWLAGQTFPADNAAAGLPVHDKIVSHFIHSSLLQDGAIHLTFGNRANGLLKDKVLTLRPAVVDDAPIVPIAWVCGYAAAPEKMTIHGVNKTTIPVKYLPLKCRAK